MEKYTFWAINAFVLKFFIILQNSYNLLQFSLYIFLASKIIKGNTSWFFCWYKFGPDRNAGIKLNSMYVTLSQINFHNHIYIAMTSLHISQNATPSTISNQTNILHLHLQAQLSQDQYRHHLPFIIHIH